MGSGIWGEVAAVLLARRARPWRRKSLLAGVAALALTIAPAIAGSDGSRRASRAGRPQDSSASSERRDGHDAARPDHRGQPHRRDRDRADGLGQPRRPGAARPAHGRHASAIRLRRSGRHDAVRRQSRGHQRQHPRPAGFRPCRRHRRWRAPGLPALRPRHPVGALASIPNWCKRST